MKPAPFDYVAPRSIADAVASLAEGGSDAKLLAGGQSLIPLLNFRLARPSLLIDLNRVEELMYIRPAAEGIAIGSMTRQASIERDARLMKLQPLLVEAIGWVGHQAIRSRGTLGGSLAHADPAAELPAVAVCLEAQLRIVGPRGQRTVAAEDFFVGYLTTVLAPDEILVETWLPPLLSHTGQAWVEFARRHGDFALAGVAVSLRLDGEQVCHARIVLTGVGGKPARAREAETLLVGGSVPERAGVAAEAARSAIDPDADIHATKEYRAHLAGVLTERATRLAHERACALGSSALDVRRTLESLGRRA
ncbi:MAG: FAD binding domain-containing protein [Chloroflexota bacterium]